MPFTPDEIDRYARHLVLRDVGGPGQLKLKAARVLVIGAGGPRVAADPVSRCGRCRHDRHRGRRRGLPLEPPAAGDPRHAGCRPPQGRERGGCGRPPQSARHGRGSRAAGQRRTTARGLIARLRRRCRRVGQFRDALRGVRRLLLRRKDLWSRRRSASSTARSPRIRAHETGPDGTAEPDLSLPLPAPPPPGTVPTCAEAGVLGALAGVMGSLMAMEVIREIVGFGEGPRRPLADDRRRSMRFDTMRYDWDETNPLSGSHRSVIPAGAQEDRIQDQKNALPATDSGMPAPGMTG